MYSNLLTSQNFDKLLSGLLSHEKLEQLNLDLSFLKLSKKVQIRGFFNEFLLNLPKLKSLYLDISQYFLKKNYFYFFFFCSCFTTTKNLSFPKINGLQSFCLLMREYPFFLIYKINYSDSIKIFDKNLIDSLGPIFHAKAFAKIELNFANSQMKFDHYQSLIASLGMTNYITSFKLNLAEFPIILVNFFFLNLLETNNLD